jgi:hypothetical protein
MWKKFQKSWPQGLWDYNIWSGKRSTSPLCPARITNFDRLLCKKFELCNYELLHHLNAHYLVQVYQILEVGDEWDILECTLHWQRVQKISITLAILVEFFVISFFNDTKIPTVDMKVQVSSNFSNKIKWKWKSPSSMRNGRFNTSKYRDKLQKMGVLYTHPLKQPRPLLHARAFNP